MFVKKMHAKFNRMFLRKREVSGTEKRNEKNFKIREHIRICEF